MLLCSGVIRFVDTLDDVFVFTLEYFVQVRNCVVDDGFRLLGKLAILAFRVPLVAESDSKGQLIKGTLKVREGRQTFQMFVKEEGRFHFVWVSEMDFLCAVLRLLDDSYASCGSRLPRKDISVMSDWGNGTRNGHVPGQWECWINPVVPFSKVMGALPPLPSPLQRRSLRWFLAPPSPWSCVGRRFGQGSSFPRYESPSDR